LRPRVSSLGFLLRVFNMIINYILKFDSDIYLYQLDTLKLQESNLKKRFEEFGANYKGEIIELYLCDGDFNEFNKLNSAF
jgi:hypothetical protein